MIDRASLRNSLIETAITFEVGLSGDRALLLNTLHTQIEQGQVSAVHGCVSGDVNLP